jgi:hypothetical protein
LIQEHSGPGIFGAWSIARGVGCANMELLSDIRFVMYIEIDKLNKTLSPVASIINELVSVQFQFNYYTYTFSLVPFSTGRSGEEEIGVSSRAITRP